MAHFAKIKNQTVTDVIVISNQHASGEFPASELQGQSYIKNVLRLDGEWLQTSYNGNFRGCFAGIDFTYNTDLDRFIPPQLYPSWIYSEEINNWLPPKPYPNDAAGAGFNWDEQNQQWVNISE